MKTLVNKNNPAIRITAPSSEIKFVPEGKKFRSHWKIGGYILRADDWTLVEEEPEKQTSEYFKEPDYDKKVVKKMSKELAKIITDQIAEPVDLEKEIKKHTDLFQADIEYPLRLTAIKFYELGRTEGIKGNLEEIPSNVDLEKFTEKIKTFQGKYKHPEIVSIKGAMAFMARMFYQYPNIARQWYEQLPKATMDFNARMIEYYHFEGILADAAKEPEPVKEDKTLGDIFEDMNKTIKESTLFDTLPKRRSRESVRWEAAERNLISLDGLRMRYKVSKATIDAAVAYLGLKLQEIEGSQAKYIDRAKISEISDYLNKA